MKKSLQIHFGKQLITLLNKIEVTIIQTNTLITNFNIMSIFKSSWLFSRLGVLLLIILYPFLITSKNIKILQRVGSYIIAAPPRTGKSALACCLAQKHKGSGSKPPSYSGETMTFSLWFPWSYLQRY